MRKKIMFMVINMNIGGTEKALLNLINELPRDQFDITILMLEKYGGFLCNIPSDVHVKYIDCYKDIKPLLNRPPLELVFDMLRTGYLIKSFNIAILYVISRMVKERTLFYQYVLKDIPDITDEYDIAVAYAGPMDLISYFIANKAAAKKKVQWIHFDINEIGFNKYFATKIYKEFDRIFTVSEEGKEKLVKMIPSINDKTKVFTNVISPKLIHQEAEKGIGFQQDNFTGIRIVTVGRLAPEKGQDLAIKALVQLINDGINAKWYCIGEGSSRKKYEKLIHRFQLQKKFILLGENSNPYRFIKECDIYVQPSRHEGYCMTLAEARALGKPIVTTDFTGAKEQINHRETGLIVEANEDQIYEAVKELIMNPKKRKAIGTNVLKDIFENENEINKVYKLG